MNTSHPKGKHFVDKFIYRAFDIGNRRVKIGLTECRCGELEFLETKITEIPEEQKETVTE